MKRNSIASFVLICLMGLSTMATAQTDRGSFLISASSSLGYSSLSRKNEQYSVGSDAGKVSTLQLNPGVGYFLANNLALGVQLSIKSYTTKQNMSRDSESLAMILAFSRLYFGSGSSKPFVQGAVGIGRQEVGIKNPKIENVSGYEVDGGVAIFLTPNIALEFILGYTRVTSGYSDNSSTLRGLGTQVGFSLAF
jgi:outer membrane protein